MIKIILKIKMLSNLAKNFKIIQKKKVKQKTIKDLFGKKKYN